ncbi:enoyl-CoA hydratase-related protein [Bradyrhizobium sp. LB11.1]|uniref:enoyl-CoA hydratase/isomerase family protein n=1 Tax=Bradyrhizobium sp. LB11.1 TaxID=3156326 RepID=UPI003392CD6F
MRDLGAEAGFEVGFVDPHPVQDAGKLARNRDDLDMDRAVPAQAHHLVLILFILEALGIDKHFGATRVRRSNRKMIVEPTMTYKTILVERRGPVHWVTLNRPEALNAINTPMTTELSHYFGDLFNDRSARTVVLRGAGHAFCAGLDLHETAEGAPFAGGIGS